MPDSVLRDLPANLDGWADPRFSDSDYFFWDEISPAPLDVLGDGIPDGWESIRP